MRQVRPQQQQYGNRYQQQISHAGSLPRWKMLGYVQSIHAGRGEHQVQYISFSISKDGTNSAEDFVYFAVTNLVDDTGVMVDKGDCVIVTGTIASWKKAMADGTNRWCIELVAQSIEEAPAGVQQLPDKPEIRAEVVPAGSDFGEVSAEELEEFAEVIGEGDVPF